MDITELKDNIVIELQDSVDRPHSARSKKPTPTWEAGTRFIVKRRLMDRRNGAEPYWELERGGSRDDVRFERGSATVNIIDDADRFLTIVRKSNPVEDVFTLFAVAEYTHPLDVFDFLQRTGVVKLETIRQGIADYEEDRNRRSDEEEAAKAVGLEAAKAALVEVSK